MNDLLDTVKAVLSTDLMHTVQAERAIMQPFILGSGPC
jgi:hypothetical protein